MRDECKVCKTDFTLEEKFRISSGERQYIFIECEECKAIAVYSPFSKRLTWYARYGEVSGVEQSALEALLDPTRAGEDLEEGGEL